jgi:hypothetical protein
MFFYSTSGPAAIPFKGGFICSAAPVRRVVTPPSSGSGTCGGVLRLDFNTYIASGQNANLTAGTTFWGQFWSRDSGSVNGSNLTDGVTAVICP